MLESVEFHAPESFNFGFDVVDYYGTEEPDRRAMIWVGSDGEEERIFTFGKDYHIICIGSGKDLCKCIIASTCSFYLHESLFGNVIHIAAVVALSFDIDYLNSELVVVAIFKFVSVEVQVARYMVELCG